MTTLAIRLPPTLLCLKIRRLKSTSPYGRSHLQRLPALPKPVVGHYPQLVVLTDGSTYTRWSTSPRSVIRLTRDLNNNPLWSPGQERSDELEDETGRMGRFRKRFGMGDGNMDFSSHSGNKVA
ncbi:hypothetical protein BS47DRAFT_1329154 [Hydnum rufescens UP504]|uniref:Ribosomal protein bL31m N-terminal domain-containing protein n=1 Tax=Hydnum rufescens UP504 TaxID=1448309 RepID=A0A9P6AXY5_9AGAM|nr:hypothetical protein BS47DRAFT_1329154 [Hydnum rufescens UP504]